MRNWSDQGARCGSAILGAGGVVVVIVGQTLAILRKPVGRLLIEDD